MLVGICRVIGGGEASVDLSPSGWLRPATDPILKAHPNGDHPLSMTPDLWLVPLLNAGFLVAVAVVLGSAVLNRVVPTYADSRLLPSLSLGLGVLATAAFVLGALSVFHVSSLRVLVLGAALAGIPEVRRLRRDRLKVTVALANLGSPEPDVRVPESPAALATDVRVAA